jgi:uncharacterized protein YacL
MSVEFIFRILGLVVFSVIGARFGVASAEALNLPEDGNGLIFSLVGALTGLILTPWITTRPAKTFRRYLLDSPIEVLITSMGGLLFGLIIALLLVWPLSLLPDLLGIYLPIIAALVSAYFGIVLFSSRAPDILMTLRFFFGRDTGLFSGSAKDISVLVDTSVIIDGRIFEMSKTGFIPGNILIPQFVLSELQHIANSSDPIRRQRGRHGLDVLNKLKQEGNNIVQVIDDEPEGVNEVDEKLVEVAKARGIPLMTNDFNLNGVANVHGVPVLNINELSLALQPVYLPGEEITVQIISEGREYDQGVGYLQDGTMVVVEGGRRYLDRTIRVVITRYIRSSAGKMYFAVHVDDARRDSNHPS